MCEASSSIDNSLPVFWGEIPREPRKPNTKILWQPIHKYKNVIQPENKFTHQHNKLINVFALERNKKNFCFDPVGQHIIKLRECHFELTSLLSEVEKEKKKSNRMIKGKKTRYERKIFPPPCPIPEFPINYPFKESLTTLHKNKPKVKLYKKFLGEHEAKEEIQNFVKQVLAQSGYFVNDQQNDVSPVLCLSNIADNFLRGFINHLKCNKNSEVFSKCDDLLGPLDTTLQEIEFGGICGLHKFYYEKIVKKHDILLKQCEDMLSTYVQFTSTIPK